jgi:hypothetical protein
MKNNILQFIEMVQKDCLEHGVKLVLHPKEKIKLAKNMDVSGYWDESKKQLHVAIYTEEWLTILAHEYGHFCQWKEGKFVSDRETELFIDFEEWLRGIKELTQKRLLASCRMVQSCELDCEKRALKLIKKFSLTDDYSLYIQKSNSYVLGYEIVRKLRKWFKTGPSRFPEINKLMTKRFIKNFKISKKQIEIMKQKCF